MKLNNNFKTVLVALILFVGVEQASRLVDKVRGAILINIERSSHHCDCKMSVLLERGRR